MKKLMHTRPSPYHSIPTLTGERETDATGSRVVTIAQGHTENGKRVGGWSALSFNEEHAPALRDWLLEQFPPEPQP